MRFRFIADVYWFPVWSSVMVSEKKRLIENILSLGLIQGLSYVVPLLNMPYLGRVISVDHFGLVFFAQAFMVYFIVITDYGFELSATRDISVHRDNPEYVSQTFSAVMTIKLGLLFLCYGILVLTSYWIPKVAQNFLLFQITFLMVVGSALNPVWLFLGMERMRSLTVINIFSKICLLLAMIVMVKGDKDYLNVAGVYAFSSLLAGVVGCVVGVRLFGIRLCFPLWSVVCSTFKKSTEFFLSRISVTALGSTNTFFLGLISADAMVGYYVAAQKLSEAMKGLQSPIKSALYPYVAKYKNIDFYKKVFWTVVVFYAVICLVCIVLAEQIVTLFYGDGMADAAGLFQLFCGVVMVSAPSTLIGYPLLGAMGYTHEANLAVVVASVFHIVGLAVLYLAGGLNAYSMVILTVVSELVIFGQWGWHVWKHQLLSRSIKE